MYAAQQSPPPGYGPPAPLTAVQPVAAAAPLQYAASQPGVDPALTRFQAFAFAREINATQGDDLFGSLRSSRVTLILDDSGSMSSSVCDPNTRTYSSLTRWSELEKLAGCCVDIVTACGSALDVVFFNRPGVANVTSPAQLAQSFQLGPGGGTPLIGTLRRVFSQHQAAAAAGQRVLVVVITDGEPSDGSAQDLFNLLATQRHPNIHVSLAECNDNEEEMAYLDGWDTKLQNFDNSDDFLMERDRIQRVNGAQYRFTYMDYAVKVLLGSLMRKYFMVDQSRQAQQNNPDGGCCTLQ